MIVHILKIFYVLFLFLSSTVVFAKTIVHKILYKAAEPYSVAIESPNGDSDWEPGIYVGDIEVGGWKLAIKGNVAMNFRTSQALHMLSFADSEKFEALAIINGYLTFFNIESTDEKQNYVSIGSGSEPIYDPVLNSYVKLPRIESIADVAIYRVNDTRLALQLVIISQKFKSTEEQLNSGITYAFLIDFSTSEKAEVLAHSPVLLEREFFQADELRNFIHTFKDGRIWLRSAYLSKMYLTHEPQEPKFVTIWKNNLMDGMDAHKFYTLSTDVSTPIFDMQSYKVDMSSLPGTSSKVGEFLFVQNYDPITKRPFLTITHEPTVSYGNKSLRPDFVIPGNILTAYRNDNSYTFKDDIGSYVDFYNHIYMPETKKEIFFFVDSVPYILLDAEKASPLRLESFPLIPNVTKFSVAQVTHFNSIGSEFNAMFLVSCRGEEPNSGLTMLYKLKYSSSGHEVKLVDSFVINRVFYGTTELKARIYGHLFDNVTEVADSLVNYRAKRNPYEAHIDLITSTSENRKYDYVEPIHFEEFGAKKEFQYKIFGNKDKPAPDSGIYFRGKNLSSYKYVSPGKLLLPKDPQIPYWSTAMFNGRRLKYQVYFLNVDLQHGNGEKVYSSLLLLDSQDIRHNGTDPIVLDLGADTSGISNLNYAVILVSDNTDAFFVLRSITRRDPDKDKENVSIEVKRIDAKDVVEGTVLDTMVFKPQEGPFKVLSRDPLSVEEVLDKILIGKGGNLYWIVSGKLKDPFFTVQELGMDRHIRPADSSEKLVFAPYRDYMKNGAGSTTFSSGYDKGPAYIWKVRLPVDETETSRLYNEHSIERLPSKSFNIFPDYLGFLESVVHERTNKKYIVVVPDELKDYVRHLTYGKLFDTSDDREWSVRNDEATFYIDRGLDKLDATKYTSYLTSITKHGTPLQKSILLMDMATLNAYGRLKAPDSMKIKFEDVYPGVDDDIVSLVHTGTEEVYVDPHALYYVLTEGNPIPPQDLEKIGTEIRPTYSTVIVASQSELEQLRGDLGFFDEGGGAGQPEARYDILSMFDIHELQPPSEEAKYDIFKEILNSPDVRKIGYVYDVSSINEEVGDDQKKAEQVFINYLISRMNSEAEKSEEDRFRILTKVFSLLKSTLLNDMNCIRNRVIDVNVAEQVLGEVFDLPINLEYLPEDDPLKILSRPDIASLFQEKGEYNGFTRMDIVDTILSQTNQEPTKHIPASIILYGESGTGKTELFLALTRVLGLKIYDSKASDEYNRDAQAFIMKCSKITSKFASKNASLGSSETMDVNTALEHLKKFLALPLGKRGFILFDDLHAADAQTRTTLIGHIRTMLDSKTTDIYEKNKNGNVIDYRTINNRNITIFITLNPASDIDEKLSKKGGSKKDNVTLYDKVIATLADKNDGSIEASFLRRFGLVTEMKSFPDEAKRASVADKLRSVILDNFTRGSLLIPTDNFISAIIGRFPNADARALLAGVNNGVAKKMTQIRQSGRQGSKSTIYILDVNYVNGDNQYIENITTESSLIKFIEANTTLYSTQSIEGQLYFTKVMADNFRNNVFDSLIYALNSSSLNPKVLQLVYLAIKHHLEGGISIPLKKLNVDPVYYVGRDFGERGKLLKQLSMPSLNGGYDMSVKLEAPVSDIMSVYDGEHEFNILNLNHKYMLKIRDFLKGFLGENLGIDSTNISTSAMPLLTWVNKIEDKRNHRYEASFDKEFYKLFSSYFLAVDSVKDEISYYSRTRLFLSIVDQAIMNLNWGKVFAFMNLNITSILRQGELTSRHGVQEFLLKRPVSLVRTPVSDNIEVTLSQNIKRGDIQEQEIRRHKDDFYEKCEDLFSEE